MCGIRHNEKRRKTLNLDENTINRCKQYAEDHALSLSGSVRTIISEYFLEREAKHDS